MTVYVVYERAVIEHEECIRPMGVFSSEDNAKEAIKEYEDIAEIYEEDFEYGYEEFRLDAVWTEIGEDEGDNG